MLCSLQFYSDLTASYVQLDLHRFVPDDEPWDDEATYKCLNLLTNQPRNYGRWIEIWLRHS